MSGTLTYWVSDGENKFRSLRLTVCSDEDRGALGHAERRRRRLSRLIREARNQGASLSYRDLCIIMLTSKATLKRDINFLRSNGMEIPLKGVTGR